MKSHIYAVILAILTFSPLVNAADLDVTGLETPRDKSVAAKRLLGWVTSLGYKAELTRDGEDVMVADTKLTLSPNLKLDSIDRIIVYNVYAGMVENKSNPELAALIADLNSSKYNANIYVDDVGGIGFVSAITFDDTLTPRMLRLFMEHANRSASLTIKNNPLLAKSVK